MGQHLQELENLFHRLAEHYRLNPSAKVLRRLRFRLWVSDFFSFNFGKVNFVYSLLVAGGVASGILYLKNPEREIALPIEESVVVAEQNDLNTDKGSEIIGETKKTVVPVKDNEESGRETMLMALFDAETFQGCAPLQIKFSDKSVMANSWHWDFGNGEHSEKRNPEYTYKAPGQYRVSLRVSDASGHEDVYYQEINVLKSPVASFGIDQDNSEIAGRKIVFDNTSEGASKYSWDFGDYRQSDAQQATHVYDDFGTYNVRLIAKSSNGCADTATLTNKFIDQNYELSFPTTFKPNPFDRSNNGYYETAGNEGYIFYPTNNGAKEYNLTIYTADGNKIFETRNIKQGWNGYFGGSLAPGGYYNYVAKGEYPNGKHFEVKGKVKVIIDDYYYKF